MNRSITRYVTLRLEILERRDAPTILLPALATARQRSSASQGTLLAEPATTSTAPAPIPSAAPAAGST